MEMSSQLHAPDALDLGKDTLVPTTQEVEWGPELVWTQWRREKNHCPYRKPNRGRPARSLVTILTELLGS